ncbi:AAA domain-containing protein [Bacillus massiliglaciei]|uniref:AAA domain-containing protein n=1 Tax=Bacillus massiliglaciei TaxID=1816693 RepID=UPI000A5A8923|nr:AAA domain-containing protein [Bacillus massiliglaciei]
MNTTVSFIKDWIKALHIEIGHLKKYGSTKYLLTDGILVSSGEQYQYYFTTAGSVMIPIGSSVRLEYGRKKFEGRILSSEKKSIIIAADSYIGDEISDVFLFYDPWELLEQLSSRLDEAARSKQKRIRIKRLMDPSMPSNYQEKKDETSLQELYLRSKNNPVTFVWGPPGTGKTHTLARTAANHYLKGKTVLILSHSNQAVDVLMGELTAFIKRKQMFKEGEFLRYGTQTGNTLKNHSEILVDSLLSKEDTGLIREKELLANEKWALKGDLEDSFSNRDMEKLIEIEKKIAKLNEKIRGRELQFLKEAKLVGTTLAKAASDAAVYGRDFDLVILDEASMAYIPQVAFAAIMGKRIIVCGDFKQLPPIASSRDSLVKQWLKEDIFHSAGVARNPEREEKHPHLMILKEQRRMHPEISAFTNHFIYQDLVGDHPSVKESRKNIIAQHPFPEWASILVDTRNAGQYCMTENSTLSRQNLWHLLLSFQLIHEAYTGGARSIGYVTPYRAQANLMDALLNDLSPEEKEAGSIMAATVHRFQGSEREIMIFDSVDSFPQIRAGMLLTGKDSERLINVAVTRTKGKFIHVADGTFIKKHIYKSKTLRQLFDFQESSKHYAETKDIGSWITHQHPRLRWFHARKEEYVFADISKAEKEIIIGMPELATLPKTWMTALETRKAGVTVTLVSGKKPDGWAGDQFYLSNISFPFLILDRKVLWLGQPLAANQWAKPPYITARLHSETISEYLFMQLQNNNQKQP